MVDVRDFIRKLGKDAPEFFGTTEKTVKRWVKTGQLPIKAYSKIDMAVRATENQAMPAPTPAPEPPAPTQPSEPQLDPYSKLPINIDRRLPEIQVQAGGHLPDVIEMSPTEQSFGVNMTRPGRLTTAAPRPPMKIKEEGGQKVAYVDNSPRTPTVLPPSIASGTGWADPKNESAPAKN